MHPVANIITQFDFGFKRLFRFYVVLAQICLITILCWIAFSKRATQMAETNGWGDFSRVRDLKWFYVSTLLALLTIPIPQGLFCCFRTIMYEKKPDPDAEDQDDSVHKRANKA